MEDAHTAALTSSNWKLLRSNPNLTVETMEQDVNGRSVKYTKISAIFPDKPEKLMKAFNDFKTFDKQTGNSKDARDYFPYFNTSEFVLKPSSGATVMKLVRYTPISSRYNDNIYHINVTHHLYPYSPHPFIRIISFFSFLLLMVWYGMVWYGMVDEAGLVRNVCRNQSYRCFGGKTCQQSLKVKQCHHESGPR